MEKTINSSSKQLDNEWKPIQFTANNSKKAISHGIRICSEHSKKEKLDGNWNNTPFWQDISGPSM